MKTMTVELEVEVELVDDEAPDTLRVRYSHPEIDGEFIFEETVDK
jgi:hypothetical protein